MPHVRNWALCPPTSSCAQVLQQLLTATTQKQLGLSTPDSRVLYLLIMSRLGYTINYRASQKPAPTVDVPWPFMPRPHLFQDLQHRFLKTGHTTYPPPTCAPFPLNPQSRARSSELKFFGHSHNCQNCKEAEIDKTHPHPCNRSVKSQQEQRRNN
jgi:hypothetical protein